MLVSERKSVMKVRRVRFLFLYVLAATAHALVDDVIDVLKLSKDIGEEVLSSWDLLAKPFNLSSGVALPIVRRREREVLARLAVVTRAIKRVELDVEKAGAVAMFLAKNSGRGTRLELRLHELSDLLGRVASADRVMREYVGLQEDLEQSTLQNFAEWCVSHEPAALPGLMERIHALIIPPHKHLLGRGMLQTLLEDLQVCKTVDIQLEPEYKTNKSQNDTDNRSPDKVQTRPTHNMFSMTIVIRYKPTMSQRSARFSIHNLTNCHHFMTAYV